MGMARKQKDAFKAANPLCIFCGGTAPATTVEHCPPRSMFLHRQWPEGYEFPACETCNHGSADADLIIAMLARIDLERDRNADGKFEHLIGSIHQQFPSLIKNMMPPAIESRRLNRRFGIEPAAGMTHQESGIVHITEEMREAVNVFGSKLAKAIFYLETKTVFPAHGVLAVRLHTNIELVLKGRYEVFDTLQALQGEVPTLRRAKSLLNDQFSYKVSMSAEKDLFALQAIFGQGFALVIFGCTAPGRMELICEQLIQRTGKKNPFTILQSSRPKPQG